MTLRSTATKTRPCPKSPVMHDYRVLVADAQGWTDTIVVRAQSYATALVEARKKGYRATAVADRL